MDSDLTEGECTTLFVGEGDFSFSANYILNNAKNKIEEIVYATCLDSNLSNEHQVKNMEKIEHRGGFVFTNVDATNLESHPLIKDLKFQKIYFNFPHIPGKMNIKENRKLVQQFFNRGQNKPFHIEGALTHVFCHGKLVEDIPLNDETNMNSLSVDILVKNNQNLYKKLSEKSSLPHLKVLSYLIEFDQQTFSSQQMIIDGLFICKHLSLSSVKNHIIDRNSIDICTECLDSLFLHFFNKKNSDSVISIVSNICCVKNISLDLHPFSHVLTYYSCNIESILSNLYNFLELLNSEFCSVKVQGMPGFEKSMASSNNKKIIETAVQNAKIIPCNEKSKTILNIYATYSKNKGNELFFYTNVMFLLTCDNFDRSESEHMKIGSVMHYYYNSKSYICILFNLDKLACLKFHIMDRRILFIHDAYYKPYSFCGYLEQVYKTVSIHPPKYLHDISFYIEDDFFEIYLHLVVLNTLGFLIKSVTLVDDYYDSCIKKYSKCYRFIYESNHQALTKRKANEIHTKVMRKTLQNCLKISLR